MRMKLCFLFTWLGEMTFKSNQCWNDGSHLNSIKCAERGWLKAANKTSFEIAVVSFFLCIYFYVRGKNIISDIFLFSQTHKKCISKWPKCKVFARHAIRFYSKNFFAVAFLLVSFSLLTFRIDNYTEVIESVKTLSLTIRNFFFLLL